MNMKLKRMALAIALTLLFIFCYTHMNQKFDRLSRYPYEGEEMREIINEHLSDEEIEYIIQYSIAPVYFMDYIECNGFNIYHVEHYHHVKNLNFYLDNDEIVRYVETAMKYENGLELVDQYASNYYFEEVLHWIIHRDPYQKDAVLIDDPNNILAYLDEYHTMGTRHPFDLVSIDLFKNENVLVREMVKEPLEALCDEIKMQFGGKCAFLDVSASFISYDEQVALYGAGLSEDYPGHSEHQLGLALDFTLSNGRPLTESKQYKWLLENAHRFGFVQTYSALNEEKNGVATRASHFRYVGNNIAFSMYNSNLTLKEVLH